MRLLSLVLCCCWSVASSAALVLARTNNTWCRVYGRCYAKLSHDDDDDNNNNNTVDLDSVSDAEALLACQAYLVRKKRVAWERAAERKRRLEASNSFTNPNDAWRNPSGLDSSTGFFWEDPTQLIYLYKNPVEERTENTSPSVENEDEDTTSDKTNEDEDDIWETVINSPDTAWRVSLPVDNDDDDDDNSHDTDYESEESALDEFAAIDGKPSPSHVRRSQAAQRRWSDPAWRAKWYERRWGNHELKPQGPDVRNLKRLGDPDAVLASPEMVALTPHEIEEAIRTYVSAKQRRRISRESTRRQRQKQLQWDALQLEKEKTRLANKQEDVLVSRDALLQQDPDQLEEARRRRSERAKLAYQTRSARRKTNSKKQQQQQQGQQAIAAGPTPTTPHEALLRVQGDLDASRLPSAGDVELMLEPSRLARRKDVLRRILSECFDLRGKCVPERFFRQNAAESGSLSTEGELLVFVTNTPIRVLGAFVLSRLQAAMKKSK